MENHIIIRARANGGKTTTSGILFEELSKKADFSKIYDYNKFKERDKLRYRKKGNLYDFIGIVIINGKVIIIISRGDVADQLSELLDKIQDKELIKKLTNNLSDKIDFYVLCARTQMRQNSTIEMLYSRIPEEERKEFRTLKSNDILDKKTVKTAVINDIITHLNASFK